MKTYHCGWCAKEFEGEEGAMFTDKINGKKAWFCSETCGLKHFFKHALASCRAIEGRL